MELKSLLFTSPQPDPHLEACLTDDAHHITPGSHGEHVKKIQIALKQSSAGPGRENCILDVDGDICMRSAPIRSTTESEIRRLGQAILQSRIATEGHLNDPAWDMEVRVMEVQ